MALTPSNVPKDVEAVEEILKEVGATDFEPQVINFLVELAYRTSCALLEDARVLAEHANKDTVTAEDVYLAASLRQIDHTTSKTLIKANADQVNAEHLPNFPSDYDARTSLENFSNASKINYALKPDLLQHYLDNLNQTPGESAPEEPGSHLYVDPAPSKIARLNE